MLYCRNESLRDNINAAKTLVIILIVFFVCWFPFFLTYILSFVGQVSRHYQILCKICKIWPEYWSLVIIFIKVILSIGGHVCRYSSINFHPDYDIRSSNYSCWNLYFSCSGFVPRGLDPVRVLAGLHQLGHQPLHLRRQVQRVPTRLQGEPALVVLPVSRSNLVIRLDNSIQGNLEEVHPCQHLNIFSTQRNVSDSNNGGDEDWMSFIVLHKMKTLVASLRSWQSAGEASTILHFTAQPCKTYTESRASAMQF